MPTGLQRVSPSHSTVCRVESRALMFRSFPSIQSRICRCRKDQPYHRLNIVLYMFWFFFFFSFFHLPVISVDPFLWSSLVFSFQRWSSVPSCRSWTQSPEWTAGLRSRPPSPLVLGLLYNTERTLSMYMCVWNWKISSTTRKCWGAVLRSIARRTRK